jgi:hypothetical protein
MINLTLAILTVLSLIVAAIMSLVAWTTKRDERRRAAARVAWLAAAIHDHGDTLPLRPPGADDERAGLFVRSTGSPGTRLAAIGVVAVLAVGAVTGLVLLAESAEARGVDPTPRARAQPSCCWN